MKNLTDPGAGCSAYVEPAAGRRLQEDEVAS